MCRDRCWQTRWIYDIAKSCGEIKEIRFLLNCYNHKRKKNNYVCCQLARACQAQQNRTIETGETTVGDEKAKIKKVCLPDICSCYYTFSFKFLKHSFWCNNPLCVMLTLVLITAWRSASAKNTIRWLFVWKGGWLTMHFCLKDNTGVHVHVCGCVRAF